MNFIICPSIIIKKNSKAQKVRYCFFEVIRLRFELKTHSLEGCCSIQLSYRTPN